MLNINWINTFLNFSLAGGELWLVKGEGVCSGERMANT